MGPRRSHFCLPGLWSSVPLTPSYKDPPDDTSPLGGPGPSPSQGPELYPVCRVPLTTEGGPSTGCGDQDMDVLGVTVQPPIPAEPRGSVRALSGDHVRDTPGPCLQLLCSSCSEGIALSHARLFSLSMPFLLEKFWVIGAPTREAREAGCRILWGPPPSPDSATAAVPGARPVLRSRSRSCCRVLSDAPTWMLARFLGI